MVEALRTVWEKSDRLCSKRLHPFLPEFIRVLRRCEESKITAEIEERLCRMSPATIDRLLRPWKLKGGRRSFSTTRPGSLLRSSIPIRTFTDWQENRPGFIEVDLVAHCGESTDGFYLNTLMAVDVATGGPSVSGYGGKGSSELGQGFTTSGRGCLSRYWGLIRTTAANLSIKTSPGGATMKVLPSPGRVLTRKTIIVSWSKRTGISCAVSSAETATARSWHTKRLTGFIICFAYMSISFSRR